MNFTPELIGVGKYTGELARWLAGCGFSVHVITAHPHYPGFTVKGEAKSRYTRSTEDGVRVTRCPLVLRKSGSGLWRLIAPLSFGVSAAPVLLWRALRCRPRVILCVEPTLMAAPAAILAAWLVGARLVLHVQDLEVDAAFATGCLKRSGLLRLGLWFERCLLRAFDHVITISTGMADRLADKGVDRRALTVVRNWMQCGPAVPVEARVAMRDRLGIRSDERVILYAGHLGVKQDVATLLSAFRRLSRRHGIRFVVVGEGPLSTDVTDSGITGLIRLPLQPQHDYATLLALADVHVLPQDARAAGLVFPSKLGPMLASGRPVVIGAEVGSDLARWVDDSAILVSPGNPEALAAGLESALNDPAPWRAAKALALAETLDAAAVLPAFAAVLLGPAPDGPEPSIRRWMRSIAGLLPRRRERAAARV